MLAVFLEREGGVNSTGLVACLMGKIALIRYSDIMQKLTTNMNVRRVRATGSGAGIGERRLTRYTEDWLYLQSTTIWTRTKCQIDNEPTRV